MNALCFQWFSGGHTSITVRLPGDQLYYTPSLLEERVEYRFEVRAETTKHSGPVSTANITTGPQIGEFGLRLGLVLVLRSPHTSPLTVARLHDQCRPYAVTSSCCHVGGRSHCLVRACDLLLAHHWQLHLHIILCPPSEGAIRLWRHMHKVCCEACVTSTCTQVSLSRD